MFCCGEVTEEARWLCDVTKLALETGIKVGPGAVCHPCWECHRDLALADWCTARARRLAGLLCTPCACSD